MPTGVDYRSLGGNNLPERVFSRFHRAKDSLTTAAHQAVHTVTTATSDSVNTFTAAAQQAKASLGATVEQTKSSLEQTRQTAGQLKNTTSEAIQTAINSSVSDWLTAHPVAFRVVQALVWAASHPILSLVILLIAVAIALSLIKAIGRLIEAVGSSLLKAPLALGLIFMKVGSQTLRKFGGLAIKQLGAKTDEPLALQPSIHKLIHDDKQQRLVEISTRLEAIRQEQNELLQEATALLTLDETN